MSMRIAPTSMASSTKASVIPAASPRTTDVTPATKTSTGDDGGASPSIAKEVSFDSTGYLVVRSIDTGSQQVVAQMPTEAYLRLAHAMIETVAADTRHTPSSDVVT